MLNKLNKELLYYLYWVDKTENPYYVVMDLGEVDEFNKNLELDGLIVDLNSYNDEINGEILISYIEKYKLPNQSMYFSNGEIIPDDFYEKVIDKCNKFNVRDKIKVRFGVTVCNAPVRSFPTDVSVFKTSADVFTTSDDVFTTSDDMEFDRFQETEIQGIEAVAILHESMDGEWFFVQSYNYKGWVKKDFIGVGNSKKEVFDFLNNDEFLVVTGDRVYTQLNIHNRDISNKCFTMGTRIPISKINVNNVNNQMTLWNYVVLLPTRDGDGNLVIKTGLISKDAEVKKGYIEYSKANVLKQGFKLLGNRYDWGNKFGNRDCSSFVMYIYKTMGFKFPRNTVEQEKMSGEIIRFNNEDIFERDEKLNRLSQGSLLFMKGHVMLYLGKVNGEHYVLHDFHGYKDDNMNFMPVNQVFVTPLSLLARSGKRFIQELTVGVEITKTHS